MNENCRRCSPPRKKKSHYWTRLEYRIKRALDPDHFPLSHRLVVFALIRLLYNRNRCAGAISNSTLELETGLSPRAIHYCLINLRGKRVIWMKRRRITPIWDKIHLIGLLSDTKKWHPRFFSVKWRRSVKARARARVRCGPQKVVQGLHPTLLYEEKGGEGKGSFHSPSPPPEEKKMELAGGKPPHSKALPPPKKQEKKTGTSRASRPGATPGEPNPDIRNEDTHPQNGEKIDQESIDYFLNNCLRTRHGLNQRLRKILASSTEAELSEIPQDLPELCLTDATSLW